MMSIEEPNKVDGLGIDKENGEVVIFISDHLLWLNGAVHFSALEKKLGNYINFVKSGQLLKDFPEGEGMPIRVKLIYEDEPTIQAEEMLKVVKQQLADIGLRFSYLKLPVGY